MSKKLEVYSDNHGIKINSLFEEKVLSNENCFWSLLQSQTDRMHYFYTREENRLLQTVHKLEKSFAINESSLNNLRNDTLWLQTFVAHNHKLFGIAVKKFDSYHNLNTFKEELRYFMESYPFVDETRLKLILSDIDSLQSKSVNVPTKHRRYSCSSSRKSRTKATTSLQQNDAIVKENYNQISLLKRYWLKVWQKG